MWPVSAQFLAAIPKPHKIVTVATYTPPGGTTVTLRLKADSGNTVTVDSTSNARRTASLTVYGVKADYDSLSLPGGLFVITHGIDFGASRELVPVITGEMIDGTQTMGNGTISFRVQDLSVWIQRTDFLAPYAPAAGTLRPQVLANIITDARPGTSVAITATDTGTVQSATWPQARFDAITALTKDGGTDAFWLPDGSFLIRDQLTISAPPVWSILAGPGGTLTAVDRKRPMDKLYNTVVVRPSATDGSQTWTQQIVQITDINNPRHPSKIGVVPYIWASPTAGSAQAAITAGLAILARVQGTAETLSLGALSNPALEAGDPIRVITPQLGQDAGTAFQHYVDLFTLDLIGGAMTCQTRSQVTVG